MDEKRRSLKTPEEWTAEFGARRPMYVEFASRLEGLMKDLLKEEQIDVIQLESRTKTVASFGEKIRRKGRNDESPFQSVTDLVGIRVITYYLDDVDRVGEIIGREFEIDPENSMNKADSLAFNQFGYRSDHYVARLRRSRSQLVEWRTYENIIAEFQVRTSLQHAWAAVSHKVEYKSADEAPAVTRRKLFQLSALFELADEQFAALRDQRAATLDAYNKEVTEGRLSKVPVDTSSIAAYWSLSSTGANFRDMLKSKMRTEDSNDITDEEIDENRLLKDRTDLVRVLRDCGLNTLADLDQFLGDTSVSKALDAVKASIEVSGEDNDFMYGSVDDLLSMVVLVAKRKGELANDIWLEPFASHLRQAADRAG